MGEEVQTREGKFLDKKSTNTIAPRGINKTKVTHSFMCSLSASYSYLKLLSY